MSRFIGGQAPAGYTGSGPVNRPKAAQHDGVFTGPRAPIGPRGPIKPRPGKPAPSTGGRGPGRPPVGTRGSQPGKPAPSTGGRGPGRPPVGTRGSQPGLPGPGKPPVGTRGPAKPPGKPAPSTGGRGRGPVTPKPVRPKGIK
jgi:hypothetical protein